MSDTSKFFGILGSSLLDAFAGYMLAVSVFILKEGGNEINSFPAILTFALSLLILAAVIEGKRKPFPAITPVLSVVIGIIFHIGLREADDPNQTGLAYIASVIVLGIVDLIFMMRYLEKQMLATVTTTRIGTTITS